MPYIETMTLARRCRHVLPVLLCALGCDAEGEVWSDPEGWEFPEWETKEDTLADGLTRTSDTSALVFRGFNAVTDATVGETCVVPSAGPTELASFRAGADVSRQTMSYVESLEELQRELDLDVRAQVKVGPLGVEGRAGITESFKSTETSLALLLRSTHVYTVINQDQVELTDDALALARTDPEAFVRKCGTHFIAGVEYGAELRVLITIETNSVEQKEEIRAELGTSGIKAGPATIDADVAMTLSETLESRGVRVTAKAEAFGFDTGVSLVGIEANPLDPSALAVVEEATDELRASVERDRCNDRGTSAPGGQCDGHAALGYLANGGRTALPTGVDLRGYRLTANFPDDQATIDAFLEQHNRAQLALGYIGAHARRFQEIVRIFNDEVGGMLDAATPYDYAIYDLGDVLAFVPERELRAYAETMALGLDPRTGSAVEIIGDSLGPCWDRADFGDFSACQDAPALAGVDALIESYSQRRIRPVFYTIGERTAEWQDAASVCGPGTRLPNKYEATRLANALWRNPDIPEPRFEGDEIGTDVALWVADERGDCGTAEGTYACIGTKATAVHCYENPLLGSDMELPVLCIPNAGPYGAEVPPL
jgi:hypothetical protein